MTERQYIEYLIATPGNYTCTHLADHLPDEAAGGHDAISDFLRREKLTPRRLWDVVAPLLQDGPECYLIFDDSVQDKRYSRRIELVKLPYSGAEGGLVRGIGVLNLLHSTGQEGPFYPIDYRVYAPEQDAKTKNDHFREMLLRAVADKQLQARTILFDSWYASVENLKLIHRLGRFFVTTLKSNRLVSLWRDKTQDKTRDKTRDKTQDKSGYTHLEQIEWTQERLEQGVLVKLKELPFAVRLFKLVAPNGDIDWIITNGSHTGPSDTQTPITSHDVKEQNAVRWQIEQLHRELKPLVGSAKCQCRAARSQRNHLACCYLACCYLACCYLACCYLAWVAIQQHAQQLQTTLYKAKHQLWSDFLKQQLATPAIPAWGL